MTQTEWNSNLQAMKEELAVQGLVPKSLAELYGELYRSAERYGMLDLCEPRKIAAPGGYMSFKGVAAGLWGNLGEAQMKIISNAQLVATEITALSVVYKICDYRVPVYWVASDFIRAVAATELPNDFTFADLHWPMPGMVLAFPIEFMRQYTGREIGFVNCAKFEAGDVLKPKLPILPPIETPIAKVAFHWHSMEGGNLGSYVAAYLSTDRMSDMANYAYVDYTDAKASVESDKAVTDKVGYSHVQAAGRAQHAAQPCCAGDGGATCQGEAR